MTEQPYPEQSVARSLATAVGKRASDFYECDRYGTPRRSQPYPEQRTEDHRIFDAFEEMGRKTKFDRPSPAVLAWWRGFLVSLRGPTDRWTAAMSHEEDC